MKLVLALAGALSTIAGAQAQTPDTQVAWTLLQGLNGHELRGCYHWKSKDCYAPNVRASLTAEGAQAIAFKTTAGTFHFRPSAAGGLEVKTPLWEGALPLAEASASELVFRKPGSELRLRVADGVVSLNYLYGEQLKRIYGFSLTSPNGQLAPTMAASAPSSQQQSLLGLGRVSTTDPAAVAYHLYGFLKPTDANKYLKFPIADAMGRGPYYLTVYSCAPQVDFRVHSGVVTQRDVRVGSYFVTTAVAQNPNRKFNYEIDAGTDSTVGLPFLVVGQVGSAGVDAAYLQAEAPVCETNIPNAQEQERRFGDFYRALGKTSINNQENSAHDYRWLNPGFAIRSGCRTVGKDDGLDWCTQYSFDVKSNRFVSQSIYAPGSPQYWAAGPRFKDQIRVASWQADIAERRASNDGGGGGGFGKALLGAVAGFAGGANGGDMTSAVAGAVAGAVGGGMGMSATDVYANSAEASADESERQAELRRIATSNLGQGSAASPAGSSNVTSANSAGGSSGSSGTGSAAGGTKSARAYFATAMQLQDHNTRNPVCYSKLFTLTFPAGGDRSEEYKAVYAAMDARADRFLASCSRHGTPVAGGVYWGVEGYDSFSVPHPDAANDIVVEAP